MILETCGKSGQKTRLTKPQALTWKRVLETVELIDWGFMAHQQLRLYCAKLRLLQFGFKKRKEL